jgi:hypothetical protein
MTPKALMRLVRTRLALPRHPLATMAMLTLAGAALAAGPSCSKTDPAPVPAQSQPDGAGSGGTSGGTSDASPVPAKDGATTIVDVGAGGGADTQAPATTCASLRNCITRCAADTACQQKCSEAATAAAKTDYATVTTCSKAGCDFNDENCRCQRECMGDGACVNQVDECRGFDSDIFCEVNCGS